MQEFRMSGPAASASSAAQARAEGTASRKAFATPKKDAPRRPFSHPPAHAPREGPGAALKKIVKKQR
jgi:hypothetical protein